MEGLEGLLFWSDGGRAEILSALLTSCMALQGYGDGLPSHINEVSLVDLFLHTASPQNYPIRLFYYRCVVSLDIIKELLHRKLDFSQRFTRIKPET